MGAYKPDRCESILLGGGRCVKPAGHDWKHCSVKASSDKQRANRLITRYGLTPNDYDEMVAAQNNRCFICEKTATRSRGRLHVDHCHRTGEVRGLLCHGCNTMLGLMHENVSVFARAAEYLTNPPSRQVFAEPHIVPNAPPRG